MQVLNTGRCVYCKRGETRGGTVATCAPQRGLAALGVVKVRRNPSCVLRLHDGPLNTRRNGLACVSASLV
jgi:hypothetical protein